MSRLFNCVNAAAFSGTALVIVIIDYIGYSAIS